MSDPRLHWHVYNERDQLVVSVADRITREAADAISAAGRFIIVLAGGSTPRPVYERLVECDTDWSRWHVYFGDERCLPAGDPDRNDTMIRAALLDEVAVPADHIHAIPAESGPDKGAAIYAQTLDGVADFDLTVLGLGEDGHTASLFPGSPLGCGRDAPDVIAVHAAPKPPAARISMSASRLKRSRKVFLLVAGREKRDAIMRWRDGADIPVRAVIPPDGIELFLDAAASPADPG